MDPLIATAASGMRSRMESLDLLANNIANASTGGYKADREFYSLYAAPEAQGSDGSSVMPVIEKPWTDYSQGIVQNTGNALDVALTGKGFFAVNGPTGTLYTRNGSFALAPDGRVVTQDGYAVRSTTGQPITLDGNRAIDIANDGSVSQDGTVIGKLQIADISTSADVAKQGNNYFVVGSPQSVTASDATVEQGKLESSNTGTAEAAVRLVSVMRQFEMLQKAVTMGAEMDQKAIENVAKV